MSTTEAQGAAGWGSPLGPVVFGVDGGCTRARGRVVRISLHDPSAKLGFTEGRASQRATTDRGPAISGRDLKPDLSPHCGVPGSRVGSVLHPNLYLARRNQ